jgi:hypothetical protein
MIGNTGLSVGITGNKTGKPFFQKKTLTGLLKIGEIDPDWFL